jgi:hypothetical protein
MKLGNLAAVVAAAITVFLHYYSAHDIQGLMAAYLGLPGLLVDGVSAPVELTVFTSVYWIFYFLRLRALAASGVNLRPRKGPINRLAAQFFEIVVKGGGIWYSAQR